MEAIIFTIANELAAIPVLQAAAAVYVRTAGADGSITRQTELVLEEIITNIIQYEYSPDQHENITLTLSVQDSVLELRLRFQGIPFDVGYLQQCEKTNLAEILGRDGRGIGLHLIRQFSDEVQYRNLGWKGQEIIIRRSICQAGDGASPQRKEVWQEEETQAKPLRIGVRRMHPDEAAVISKLAYFSYHYTYLKEYIYDPDEIRQRNERGRMNSYVAVNEETGEILGHLAMPSDDMSDMPELSAAVVNPRFRRSGCLTVLIDHMIRDAQEQGWQGIFGTAVTSHIYSQISPARMGLRESALLVSRLQPLSFQAITDKAEFRESILYMVRLFDSSPRRSYYPPPRHREMIEKIRRNVNMTVSFADNPDEMTLSLPGVIETETDANRGGHIILRRWGGDTLSKIRSTLHRWCLDRLETIFLYLPLTQPPTAFFCAAIEEMGFFFSGLIPGHAGEDWLVLQYLNNQRYDYRCLKAATPFGGELIEYVKACDPVVRWETGEAGTTDGLIFS